jgi:16S rRNA processing protein RimM
MQEYSVAALDGCAVQTEEGETLGLLRDVFSNGANDIFVVRGAAREYLIPALKTVVMGVDLAARRITVRLPAGLREVYES